MKLSNKYENLQKLLPRLPAVLFQSLQTDVLDIKEMNPLCDKYSNVCTNHEEIHNAKYVIYSPYVGKKDRKYETFIFVDEQGTIVAHLSGQEMQLYGMIHSVHELHHSEDYIFNNLVAQNSSLPRNTVMSDDMIRNLGLAH